MRPNPCNSRVPSYPNHSKHLSCSDMNSKASTYAAAALALMAIAVGGFFIFRHFNSHSTVADVDVARTTAEAFLSKMRTGKAGEAWDTATAEFKSIEGRESFVQKAKATPILTSALQFNSSQSVTIQNVPRTELLFQSPNAKIVRVLIGFERGEWKVDRLTL